MKNEVVVSIFQRNISLNYHNFTNLCIDDSLIESKKRMYFLSQMKMSSVTASTEKCYGTILCGTALKFPIFGGSMAPKLEMKIPCRSALGCTSLNRHL